MDKFNELGLNNNVLKAINELGFVSPTEIQTETIPAILNSTTDLIALAQTGTGKTAGFGLPVLQQINLKQKSVQCLVLCPTRELCLQITNDLTNFSKYLNGLKIVPVYGGANISNQIKELKQNVQVVVGTPGRTLDLIKRRVLAVDNINWLILDEADEMLNMGFKEDLDIILSSTPDSKQTLLFSATMPDGIRKIASNYMNDPQEILSGKKNTSTANVSHQFYVVKATDRYAALKRIADLNPSVYALIFCRTRKETQEIADHLIKDGYNADALHGDLSQAQRDHVMNRFRLKNIQLLVATDVAARGLDVNDLTHVINYNLPDDYEVYIHRSGRTGRAGKKGISVSIIHSREGKRIKELEKLTGREFEHKKVPDGKQICEKRLYNLIDKVEKVEVNEEQIQSFLPSILQKLEWLDRDELIKKFVSVEFNRFLDYYKKDIDLNVDLEIHKKDNKNASSSSGKNNKRRAEEGFTRFFINIGSKQKINASRLISIINSQTKRPDLEIGKIDILRNFSFFEMARESEKEILKAFKHAMFENEKINVQVAQPESKKNKESRNNNFNRSKGNTVRRKRR